LISTVTISGASDRHRSVGLAAQNLTTIGGGSLRADRLPQRDGALRDIENNVHIVDPIGALNGITRKINKY